MIRFLENTLICDKIMKIGTFEKYVPETFEGNNDYLILDAHCLQHLEIIESQAGKKEGSLFGYLDRCSTPFGRRELKRWLMRPLTDIGKINDRYDAVEDLLRNLEEVEKIRVSMSLMTDLERLLAKTYTYSIHQKKKAFYFEDVNLKKLTEFRVLLSALKNAYLLLEPMIKLRHSFNSR